MFVQVSSAPCSTLTPNTEASGAYFAQYVSSSTASIVASPETKRVFLAECKKRDPSGVFWRDIAGELLGPPPL